MACRGVLSGESRHFVAVAANRHRTPAAAVRARGVVKEEPAPWIGTDADARPGTFNDHLSSRPCNRREQPIQSGFARDVFDPPGVAPLHQFVVAFGDAEHFVDRLDPFVGDRLLSHHGAEDAPQRGSKPTGFLEQMVGGLRVTLRQEEQARAPLGRNYTHRFQEAD